MSMVGRNYILRILWRVGNLENMHFKRPHFIHEPVTIKINIRYKVENVLALFSFEQVNPND